MTLQDHARTLERLRAENRARGLSLPADLFRPTPWDMLLDLAQLTASGRRVCVTGLACGALVKPTTGLRYCELLEEAGLIGRADDPRDGRRQWVHLTGQGEAGMVRFLAAVEARRGDA